MPVPVSRRPVHVRQINLLIALTDIGLGDGGTMVIPGSHKANFEHPLARQARNSVDEVQIEDAIELHMKAGDALMFVDAVSHGSAKRINEGTRRIVVFRYGPSWATSATATSRLRSCWSG